MATPSLNGIEDGDRDDFASVPDRDRRGGVILPPATRLRDCRRRPRRIQGAGPRTTARSASGELGADASSASVIGFTGQRNRKYAANSGEIRRSRATSSVTVRPQKPALARTHPATRVRLRLIRPARTKAQGLDHLLRGDVLAAADDGVATRHPEEVGGPVHCIEVRASAQGAPQRGAWIPGRGVARLRVDAAERIGDRQRGEMSRAPPPRPRRRRRRRRRR